MFKTVKSKVALIYVSLVAVIILLGAISLWNMVRIGNTIDGLIVTNYNSIVRLNSMKETLREQSDAIYAHIYGSESDSSEQVARLDIRFMANYNDEYQTIIIPEEKQYIDNIGAYYRAFLGICETLLSIDPADTSYPVDASYPADTSYPADASYPAGASYPAVPKQAALMYETDLIAAREKVEEEITRLYISNETALFARKEAAASSARSSILLLGIIFPAAALGGYCLATLYTKRFFAPLYEITQSVKHIMEGHLRSESRLRTEDEFGMLSSEFNDMISRLREFEDSAIGSIMNERGKSDSLVRSINEPLLVLDKDLNIVEMNNAFQELFNTTPGSKGMPLEEAVFHEELLRYIERPRDAVQSGETIAISTSEDDLFYHVMTTPMLGKDDDSTGTIVTFHNITEMKLLEKARGDFIATISHEFKTPLTGIAIGADLLSDSKIGPLNDDQREIVETIKEDSDRLGVLVGEVLELSRIESSKAVYDFTNCDIGQIIAISIKQFLVHAERNGITLESHCPADIPPVRADFSKITWVLNNLLSNAMKYTGSGDSVSIVATESNDGVVVSVKDTGMGIPAEYVDNIFEKFIPIKEYDIEVRGSGVGLAVSKEIVTAHGGRIWCESLLTKGSNFSFTLQYATAGE